MRRTGTGPRRDQGSSERVNPHPAASTLFEFTHQAFRAPDARFLLGGDGQPCMALKLGTLDALVPLSSLIKEFDLAGTADGALLEMVVSGLKFVKLIRPGDSIPREILDGTASWSVSEENLATARGRLTLQLYGFLGGQERVLTDAIEIMQMVDDPGVQARIRNGTGTVLDRLGLGADQGGRIDATLDRFARDLAYIVALRERAGTLGKLMEKVAALRRVYRRDRTVDEELIRVNNLLQKPINRFHKFFAEVDAHTGEILGILANVDQHLAYVRESRDTLHLQLMKWDDLFAAWETLAPDISSATEGAIRRLYQFLAQNFLVESSW
jgi:hypothetical protein